MSDELLRQMAAEAGDEPEEQPAAGGTRRLADLAQRMIDVKTTIEDMEEDLSALKKEYNELRSQSIPEAMQDAGLVSDSGKGSFTLETGETVYIKNDLFANVNAVDREALFEYLREQGAGDLIKPTVNHNTLRAYAKEQLERGVKLPEIIKTSPFQTVSIRKRR